MRVMVMGHRPTRTIRGGGGGGGGVSKKQAE